MDLDPPTPIPIFALFLNNVFTSSLKNHYCTFFLCLWPCVCVWKVFIFSPLGAILCHSPTAKACCLFCLKLSDLESQVGPHSIDLGNWFVVKHPMFSVAVLMEYNPNTMSVVPQTKENRATRYYSGFPVASIACDFDPPSTCQNVSDTTCLFLSWRFRKNCLSGIVYFSVEKPSWIGWDGSPGGTLPSDPIFLPNCREQTIRAGKEEQLWLSPTSFGCIL